MKKGFTLIELLGVILLLGVIATISVPVVLNVLDGVKEKSDEEIIKIYIKAVDNKLAQLRIKHKKISDGEYHITKDGNLCPSLLDANGDCISDIIQIDYSGNKISSGEILVENEKVKTYQIILNENEYVTGYENNGACYNFDSQTGTILEYYDYENNDSTKQECSKDVVIPPYINNVKVVEIGSGAFYSKGITKVKFPNTLKIIGDQAFILNSLTTLVIPDSVETISRRAFAANSLESVEIGSGIKNIGSEIFMSNNNLSLVRINTHQSAVSVNEYSFLKNADPSYISVCWLKDTPNCGS